MQRCGIGFLDCPALMTAEVRAGQIHLCFGRQTVSQLAWTPNGIRRTLLLISEGICC